MTGNAWLNGPALVALVFAAPAGLAQLADVGSGPLKVGIARADITPEGAVWMAGFAARKERSRPARRAGDQSPNDSTGTA